MNIFYWCTGQDDNIGDVVLRRRYAETLRRMGTLHVYVGSASASFLAGMGFAEDDVRYTSAVAWIGAIADPRNARRGVLAFNPGELQIGRKSAISSLVMIPFQLWLALLGGKSVKVGVATRGRNLMYEVPVRISNALCDFVAWRDTESRETWGVGLNGLDWAFDESLHRPHGEIPRTKLALTMRSDRPELSDAVCSAISEIADRRQLQLTVFTQVRRDRDSSRKLASRLDCELVDWNDSVDHLEQERIVRDLARQSVAILSDRIHALIVGVSEGAAPVGIMMTGDRKVRPHFDAAGLHSMSANVYGMGHGEVVTFVEGVIDRAPDLCIRANNARDKVQQMADTLSGVLRVPR